MALRFTLAGKTVPVELSKDGSAALYELREMTAAARDRYLDKLGGRVKIGPDGKPAGVTKFEGMQADLLSACLFDHTGKAVTIKEIQEWPATVVSGLFDEAQKVNLLNQKEEEKGEEPKNE